MVPESTSHPGKSKLLLGLVALVALTMVVYAFAGKISCGAPNKDEGREVGDINMVDESLLHSLARASSPSEALRLLPVSVGDKVRIVPSPITDELGISGMFAKVTGLTFQSDSGNPAVEGSAPATGATVHIEELGQDVGLSANLLEIADLPVGAVVSMGDKEWILNQDGRWTEAESVR